MILIIIILYDMIIRDKRERQHSMSIKQDLPFSLPLSLAQPLEQKPCQIMLPSISSYSQTPSPSLFLHPSLPLTLLKSLPPSPSISHLYGVIPMKASCQLYPLGELESHSCHVIGWFWFRWKRFPHTLQRRLPIYIR